MSVLPICVSHQFKRKLYYGLGNFSTGAVTRTLNNNWLAVLNSGQQLDFQCTQVKKLFSYQLNGFDFFVSFHTKYPFVRRLLADASKFNHPLNRFLIQLNHQEQTQHGTKHGENEGLKSTQFSHRNVAFQYQENLFVLTVTLLITSKMFWSNNSGHEKDNDRLKNQEQRQIHLTQAAQMLYLSQRFHETVRNDDLREGSYEHNRKSYLDSNNNNTTQDGRVRQEYDKGNKIATLVGDLFITEMYSMLSLVENNEVVRTMSETLAEFSQENFSSSCANLSTVNKSDPTTVDDKSGSQVKLYSNKKNIQMSEKAVEILFANYFYCCSVLSGQKDKQFLQFGPLFGKLYFSHKRALQSIESLLCSPGAKSQTQSALQILDDKIIEELSHDFTKLRHAKEEIRDLAESVCIDERVSRAFGALTNFLSFDGIHFPDKDKPRSDLIQFLSGNLISDTK